MAGLPCGGKYGIIYAMSIKRRDFLRTAAASAVALSFPSLRARAASPLGKVRMAFIGVGNRAGYDLAHFTGYYRDQIDVVALCDTQMGASHTLKALRSFPQVPRYTDFRKMLEKHGRQLDAVCIGTPDFSHFPAAMLAMSMGIAVYCEKPMCNNFREVALMTAAAKRHRVVTQMGNQGHSAANYWQMKALVESGYIKDVTRIDAFMCADRRWHKWKGTLREMPGAEPKPAEMDWNAWLAQRPDRPYNRNFINGDWRSFYEYGTGALGDWGAHIFDAAHEFLKLGLPTRIEMVKDEGNTPVVYPMASTIRYVFPARGPGLPACTLNWHDGRGNYPAPLKNPTDPKWSRKNYGAELHLLDGRVFSRTSHDSPLQVVAGADPRAADVKRAMRDYPRGKSEHYLNFLKAVRGEEKANSDFSVAGPLSEVLALGAVAQRLGAPSLEFDPVKGKFVGNDTANAFLAGPPARKGWEEFEKL